MKTLTTHIPPISHILGRFPRLKWVSPPISLIRAIPRRQRWFFLLTTLIILIPLITLMHFYLPNAQAAWYDDSFAYRTKYTIGNSGSTIYSARKVKIEVDTATLTTDKMQADCDDVRFTDLNGKLLRHFIDTDEGACDTSSTDFYVELPQVLTGNSIVYMYYGNPSAVSGRSPEFFAPTTELSSIGNKLKGFWGLEETSGTRYDRAHENTLTDNNTVLGTTKSNNTNMADFEDGNSEYLSLSDNTSVSTGDFDFTITAWVKAEALSGLDAIVAKATNATTREFLLGYNNASSGVFDFNIYNSSGTNVGQATASDPGAPSANTWYYIVAWHDASADTVNIQVNNGTVGSTATSGSPSDTSASLRIGSYDGTQFYWDGVIGNVGYWKRKLTTEEKTALYNSGNGQNYNAMTTGAMAAMAGIKNGIVGFWNLDEYSAGSGAITRADVSGNGNNLTDNNTTASAPSVGGKLGGAGDFEADNSESLSKTDNADLSLGSDTDFTFATWVNLESKTSNRNILGKGDSGGASADFEYLLNYSTAVDRFRFTISDDTTAVTATADTLGSPSTSTWYYIVAWHDKSANTVNIQVNNGTADSTAWSSGTFDGADGFAIGRGGDYIGGNFGDGLIDNTMFWKRTLTTAERTALYNSGNGVEFGTVSFTPTSGPTAASEEKAPSPVAYWNFDEGQGTNAQDTTVNNNDGTISGATWTEESRCISGKCLQFDGTDDVVTVSNSVNNIQSVSFWVRPATTSEQFIDLNGSAYIQSSSGTISATGFTSPTIYVNGVVSSTIIANQWQHITVTTGSALTGSAIKLGQISTNYGQVFLDEAKLYPYARTSAQVQADFAKASSAKGGGVLGAQKSEALSEGLVGYWKMDESAANGCTGGVNDSCDSSGNGNNGAWNGGTVNTTGKFGNGTSYDGTSDYTQIGNPTSLNPSYITVSSWAKPNSGHVGSGSDPLVDKGYTSHATPFYQYHLGITGDSYSVTPGAYTFSVSVGGSLYTARSTDASDTYTSAVWTHFVGTYDGETVRLYKNGQLIDEETSPSGVMDTYSTNMRIGGFTNLTSSFNGTIDETRVYNRSLSPAEVRQLYAFAPSPVGHWKMEERSGNRADSSGNGNTLTDNNTVTSKPGKFGTAGQFTAATTEYLSLASFSTFSGASQVTASFWLYPDSSASTHTPLSIGSTTGMLVYLANPGGAADSMRVFMQDGSTYVTTAANYFVDNTWVYATIVYDGTAAAASRLKIYKNGVEQSLTVTGTLPTTFATGAQALYIGGLAAANPWDGRIDDAKLYNYARTQKQIIEDMNAGHPAGGSPVGSAVSTWHMDDMEGTVAEDSNANGNDLTLSSASWTTSGKVSGAWNGTNAVWLSRADDADFDVSATDDYAISAWVKSDSASNPGATEYIINKASATVAGYAMYFNTSGQICIAIDDDTTWSPDVASCSSADFYDNSWHHVVGVRNTVADETRIYVDGISRDNDSDSTSATLANSLLLYVGDRDGTNNGDEFAGDIDEVNIYRFAPNVDDVRIIMNINAGIDFGSTTTEATGTAPVATWKMDEGADGTCAGGTNDVCDTSGTGNDGAITGATWKTAADCHEGKCLSFNGTSDYVNMGTSSSLDLYNDLTISVWIKPTDWGGSNLGRIIARGVSTSYNLLLDASISGFNFECAGTNKASSNNVITLNQWQQITVVKSSTNLSFYVNGNPAGTATSCTLSSTPGLSVMIGSRNGGDRFFNGKIDDARIYNYARSAAQVAQDYNRGAPVAWWKLDECQGSTVRSTNTPYNSLLDGTITIGASGSNTAVGDCQSGTSTHAWYNGVTGKRNYSLSFDGTDDYVSIVNESNFDFERTNAFSVCSWVNPVNDTDANHTIVAKMQDSSPFTGWELMLYDTNASDSDGITFSLINTWSSNVLRVDAARNEIETGTWQHVCATYDGSSSTSGVSIYLNGVSKTVNSVLNSLSSSILNSLNLEIGSRQGGRLMKGQIDDVRIYNYALSAAQVRNVYNGGAVRFGPSTGSP